LFTCVVEALAEVSPTLESCWHQGVSDIIWRKLALELLAPEKECLVANALKYFRNIDRSPDRISRIVVPEQRFRQASEIIQEGIRIEAVVAVIPIAAAVVMLRAALGYQRNLPAYAAAVFGLVGSCEHLELGDGIHAQD